MHAFSARLKSHLKFLTPLDLALVATTSTISRQTVLELLNSISEPSAFTNLRMVCGSLEELARVRIIRSHRGNFKSVAASLEFAIALTCSGLLCFWKDLPVAKSLRLARQAVSVACGGNHVLLLDAQGILFTFGSGEAGQLGHGRYDSEAMPRQVAALSSLCTIAVSAGYAHSLVLTVRLGTFFKTATTSLYAFGWNKRGQLGLGTLDETSVPEQVTDSECWYDWCHWYQPPWITFCRISCGYGHSAAVTSGGELYTWGTVYLGITGHGLSSDHAKRPRLVDRSTLRSEGSHARFLDVAYAKFIDVECGTKCTVALSQCPQTFEMRLWATGMGWSKHFLWPWRNDRCSRCFRCVLVLPPTEGIPRLLPGPWSNGAVLVVEKQAGSCEAYIWGAMGILTGERVLEATTCFRRVSLRGCCELAILDYTRKYEHESLCVFVDSSPAQRILVMRGSRLESTVECISRAFEPKAWESLNNNLDEVIDDHLRILRKRQDELDQGMQSK